MIFMLLQWHFETFAAEKSFQADRQSGSKEQLSSELEEERVDE